MKRSICLILTVIMLCSLTLNIGAADENAVTVLGHDISDFVIVIPDNTSESQRTASSELVSYLERICSVTLNVVTDAETKKSPEIVLGFTNRLSVDAETVTELGEEGFIIRTSGDSLFILGSEVRGTLYGTYTFLEEYLNCRFYSKDFEVVPVADNIVLDEIKDKQIPGFEFRDSYWYSLNTKFSAAKLKINSNHGREESSLDSEVGGGITYAQVLPDVGFVHTLPLILGSNVYTPVCFSSEANYNSLVKFVSDFLKTHPNEKIISLSHNDGAGACTCKDCKKALQSETYSGIMLKFINRVASQFEKDYPNLKFDTLAYRSTQEPPKNVKPNSNVIVRFCSIDTCFRHPISADCVEWGKGLTYDHLVEWSNLCTDGNLYIWNYTTNFTDFNMIYANFANFHDDMQLFKRLGVTGVFEQGNIASDAGEFGTLKGYIISKLLWNPDMTEEEYWKLIDRFLMDYYGEGGVYIREFIDYSLESSPDAHFGIYFDDPGLYVYDRSEGSFDTSNMTGAQKKKYIEARQRFINKSTELFENAKELATPAQLARIDQSQIQLYNYIAFTGHRINEYGFGTTESAQTLRDANREAFQRIKKYGISNVCEFTPWDIRFVNYDSYVLQWGWDKRYDWDTYNGPYGSGKSKISSSSTQRRYTVVYDSNGGEGNQMKNSLMVYGLKDSLSENTYEKSGYIFIGWATDRNGEAVYSDGEIVSNLTRKNGDTVTLYAVWSKDNGSILGDSNRDGKITTSDAILVLRKTANWEVDIDMSAADVNADGNVNTTDAILILRKLAWGN